MTESLVSSCFPSVLPKLKLRHLTSGTVAFNYGELRTFITERKLLVNKVLMTFSLPLPAAAKMKSPPSPALMGDLTGVQPYTPCRLSPGVFTLLSPGRAGGLLPIVKADTSLSTFQTISQQSFPLFEATFVLPWPLAPSLQCCAH